MLCWYANGATRCVLQHKHDKNKIRAPGGRVAAQTHFSLGGCVLYIEIMDLFRSGADPVYSVLSPRTQEQASNTL